MITSVARAAFPVVPMHIAKAPTAGSGKSYLWDVAAAIGLGQLMPVMAVGRTEEETEKRLGAALIAGQPLLSIDNVNGELGGDALCQAIERPVINIRILGKSEHVQIEARGLSLFATGNNITTSNDLTRRVITATLDPQMEQPESRDFAGDPVATVMADRGAYIAACLTICRAYVAAGRPKPKPRPPKLASFGEWSDTVRSALVWLERDDCVTTMEVARTEDPGRNALRAMLTTWAEAFGTGPEHSVTLAKAVAKAEETNPKSGTLTYPELSAAIMAVGTPWRAQQVDLRKLGHWMQRHRGNVVDGMRFANDFNPKGGSKWWIETPAHYHQGSLFLEGGGAKGRRETR
jgi:hypothetical protein